LWPRSPRADADDGADELAERRRSDAKRSELTTPVRPSAGVQAGLTATHTSPRPSADRGVDVSCGGERTAAHPVASVQSDRALQPLDVEAIDARELQRHGERIRQMQGGLVLYKYQRGEGGFKLFARQEKRREERVLRLSADASALSWAKSSGGGRHTLPLAEVTGVTHGHDSQLFRQMLIVPDAAELCLSIETARRVYSFAARTPAQAEVLVVGLSKLRGLPMARRGAFLWNELRLRSRAEAQGTGLAALLPRIARDLEHSRPTPNRGSEAGDTTFD
jgi:hypothetical protein